MNGEDSKVDKLNQSVRAIVVIMLTAAYIYGFVGTKVVNTESFSIILGMAITWLFKARDEKKAADDAAAIAKAAATPPPPPPPTP